MHLPTLQVGDGIET